MIATKLMLHELGFGSVYKTIRSHLEGSLERLQGLFFYRLYRDHDTVYDDGMSADVCIKYDKQ